MNDNNPNALNLRRLSALISDMIHLEEQHSDLLSEDERYLLHDLHAQLRGMQALLSQQDPAHALDGIIHAALCEFVRLQLHHGLIQPV